MSTLEIVTLIVLPTCTLILGFISQRWVNMREDKRAENEKNQSNSDSAAAITKAATELIQPLQNQIEKMRAEQEKKDAEYELKIEKMQKQIDQLSGYWDLNARIKIGEGSYVVNTSLKPVPNDT
jgi:peptidoglycan hydrolase CwlO-like protein